MKEVPIQEAERFCEEYKKDQCIILSWDEKSNLTWVTTYGTGHKNSIQAANAGKILKDYLELKRDCDEIPTRLEEWKINKTESWWESNGRNGRVYYEITHWYETHTRKQKTSKREFSIPNSDYTHTLPEWAQGITNRKTTSNDNYIY